MSEIENKKDLVITSIEDKEDYVKINVKSLSEEIIQARVDENNRTIKTFMSLPPSGFLDLEIKSILEKRNKELKESE